jgi:ComF family protein
MSPFLCSACVSDFQPVTSPLCLMCGQPFETNEGDNHHCENCIRSPRHFDQARAVGTYDGALKTLIQRFKFLGKSYLAEPLGILLAHQFYNLYRRRISVRTFPDLILPVPLHARKQRMRGFNQAFLLCRYFISILGQSHPEIPPIEMENDVLIRHKWTEPQTGLHKDQRKLNIARAFNVRFPEKTAGKHILLVDDVYTTGSTVDECAGILKRAGKALRVDVLTLARA